MKKKIRLIKIKIAIIIFIPSLIFLYLGEVFEAFNSLILDQAGIFSLKAKLLNILNPYIFMIFIIFYIILLLIILWLLKPLFDYFIKKNIDYEKAKNASLNIAWLILLFNFLSWGFGVLIFYMLRGWKNPDLLPLHWALFIKTSYGLVGGLYVALIVDIAIMNLKKKLKIFEIKDKEKDRFSKYKEYIAIMIISYYLLVNVSYLAYYYFKTNRVDISPLSFYANMIFWTIFFFISIFFLVIISRNAYYKQVRFLNNKIIEISHLNADLTQKINLINFDEIGELAFHFNQVIENLNNNMDDVKRNTFNSLNCSKETLLSINKIIENNINQKKISKEISGNMNSFMEDLSKINQNIETQINSIKNINFCLENFFQNTNKIFTEMKDIKKKLITVIELSELGKNDMAVTLDNSISFDKKMDNILNKMNDFQKNSEDINGVLKIIEEISNKTHTISINAFIESARAGEKGNGFNIIAKDIKSLSNDSIISVKKIEEIIKLIKFGIKDIFISVDAGKKEALSVRSFSEKSNSIFENIQNNIRDIEKKVSMINEDQYEQNNFLNQIITDSNNLTKSSKGIQDNTNKQFIIAKDIDNKIEQINYSIENSSLITDKLNYDLDQLGKLNKDLEKTVNQYKIDEKNKVLLF